jgi:hypothetical protein
MPRAHDNGVLTSWRYWYVSDEIHGPVAFFLSPVRMNSMVVRNLRIRREDHPS